MNPGIRAVRAAERQLRALPSPITGILRAEGFIAMVEPGLDWLKASPFDGFREPTASPSDADSVEPRARRAPREWGPGPVAGGGGPPLIARDASLHAPPAVAARATTPRSAAPAQSAKEARESSAAAASVAAAFDVGAGRASGSIGRPAGDDQGGNIAPVFSLRQLLGDRLASVLAPAGHDRSPAGTPSAPPGGAVPPPPSPVSLRPAPRSEGGGAPGIGSSHGGKGELLAPGDRVNSALAGIARRLEGAAGGRSASPPTAPDALAGRTRSVDPAGIEEIAPKGGPQPGSGTQPTRITAEVSGRAAFPDLRASPTSSALDAPAVPAAPDPDWVIAVVSDALVEQARRQGVDLS